MLMAALGQWIRGNDEVVEREQRHASAGALERCRQETQPLEPLERERGERALSLARSTATQK